MTSTTVDALGVLELKNGRDGFLRRKQNSYLAESGDTFVAQRLIQRFGLRTGDLRSLVVFNVLRLFCRRNCTHNAFLEANS